MQCDAKCCSGNGCEGGEGDSPTESDAAVPFLLPPLIPLAKPTVIFGARRRAIAHHTECRQCSGNAMPIVKISEGSTMAVRAIVNQAGVPRAHPSSTRFTLLWTGCHMPHERYKELRPGQKVNHFPGTWELGRKDKLAMNICRLIRRFGAFHPLSIDSPSPSFYCTKRRDVEPSVDGNQV